MKKITKRLQKYVIYYADLIWQSGFLEIEI